MCAMLMIAVVAAMAPAAAVCGPPKPGSVAVADIATVPIPVANEMAVADMNGDGVADVIASGGGGVLDRATPRRSVQVVVREATPRVRGFDLGEGAGMFRTRIATADLDADGDVDVAATDDLGARLLVLDNDGTGVLAQGWQFDDVRQPQDVEAADIDGDGTTDLLATSWSDDCVLAGHVGHRGQSVGRHSKRSRERLLVFIGTSLAGAGGMVEPGATMDAVTSSGRRASYQDVLDAPEHAVAELIDGVLHTHARPRLRHGVFASRLGAVLASEIDDGVGRTGGFIVIIEPELHLHGDVLVPDLAAWQRDRFPPTPDVVGIDVAPDWVCEVLSPTTAKHDRLLKLPKYALADVPWLWLVDPVARTLEVYRRADPLWHLVAIHDGSAPIACMPFPAVTMPLPRMW